LVYGKAFAQPITTDPAAGCVDAPLQFRDETGNSTVAFELVKLELEHCNPALLKNFTIISALSCDSQFAYLETGGWVPLAHCKEDKIYYCRALAA
jgi:hypothetical protein